MLVLLIPDVSGHFILAEPRWNVASLVSGSLVIAYLFRAWIAAPGTFSEQVGKAIVITYAGCFVYLTVLNLSLTAVESFRFGATARLQDWLSRYFWGMLAALSAFYVVIPYGVVCQLVMNRISRAGSRTN
jgi:hypothetical protein